MKNYRYDPDKLKFVEDENGFLNKFMAVLIGLSIGIWLMIALVSYFSRDVDQPPTKRSAVMVVSRPLLYAVTGTYYNAEAGQCDDRPTETADGSQISLSKLRSGAVRWVALSRDLLKRWGGHFDYGDTIHVWHHDEMLSGRWVVRDCMNKRFKRRIDFLVDKQTVFPGLSHGILISKDKIEVL